MTKRPFPSYWMFRDKDGNWRWNFAAGNGKVIAASSVAYMRKEGCIRAIGMLKGSAEIPVFGPQADVQAAAGKTLAGAASTKTASAE